MSNTDAAIPMTTFNPNTAPNGKSASDMHAPPPTYDGAGGQYGAPQLQPGLNYQQQYQPPEAQAPGQQPPNNYGFVTPLASLQSVPAPVDCPVCGTREMTSIEFMSGNTTHGCAALICFFTCLGCIPYMASWFKDCEHRCSKCGARLALWHRSGRTEVLTNRKT